MGQVKGFDLHLRDVSLEDSEIIFNWRNDETTRSASHSMNPLSFEEHVQWFKSSLNNPNRRLYIAEYKGQRVGTVRTDFIHNVFLLSWIIAPNARGQGVGKRMVGLLANSIQAPIKAEIKKDNLASIKIAIHAGLELHKEDEQGILHFKRGEI